MKTTLLIMLVMFLPGWMLGQGTTIKNDGNGAVIVSADGRKLGAIYAKTSKTFSELPCDKTAELDIVYLRSSRQEHLKISKAAGTCEVSLKKDASSGAYSEARSNSYDTKPAPSNADKTPLDNVDTQLVGVTNNSDKFIFFEDGPFAGLCLSPMDSSNFKRRLKQGPGQSSLVYMDSTNQKAIYKEVYTYMVPQGEKMLIVNNAVFTTSYAPDGKAKRKMQAMLFIDNESGYVLTPVPGFCGPLVNNISKGKSKYSLHMKDLATKAYVFEFFDRQGHKHRITVTVVLEAGQDVVRITPKMALGNSEVAE